MLADLGALFERVPATLRGEWESGYAVVAIPGYARYFVGKDGEGHACLLISTAGPRKGTPAPIRLASVDVQFEMRCDLRRGSQALPTQYLTVIRCRSVDKGITRYFLSLCSSLVRLLGRSPTRVEIAAAVEKLAAILSKNRQPASRTVNGLVGELYLIRESRNPRRALSAWRIDDVDRFDFVDGKLRLEAKTAAGRVRTHMFTYEQCSPPRDTVGLVASMFIERVTHGLTMEAIIADIVAIIGDDGDLVFRLYDVVSATLGNTIGNAMSVAFDEELLRSSLQFFKLSDVPAVRGILPAGVSNVAFRSNLEHLDPIQGPPWRSNDNTSVEILPPSL